MIEGSMDAKILFINDYSAAEVLPLIQKELLINACKRAGLLESEYAFTTIHSACSSNSRGKADTKLDDGAKHAHWIDLQTVVLESKATVLIPLGEHALQYITGFKSIMKHHCTIVPAKSELGGKKCVPLIHPEIVFKDFKLSAYISFGIQRAKEEMLTSAIVREPTRFIIDQNIDMIMGILKMLKLRHESLPIAVDVETSRGKITVVGIAWSDTEAIAIDVRAAGIGLWWAIRDVLEGPWPKYLQNHVYDCECFRHVPLNLKNIDHDTMLAMKLLHPELDKGLENVARIYTRYPYWKDDAKDWSDVRNFRAHLEYNCMDTTATFKAAQGQKRDLRERGLEDAFNKYLMGASNKARQMCAHGIGFDRALYAAMYQAAESAISEAEASLAVITFERFGERINARSPEQIKRALRECGINVPTQNGHQTTNRKALISLSKKYPQEQIIKELITLSNRRGTKECLDKIGSHEHAMHYLVDSCINEFGEWAGYPDIRGEGCYPADVPRKVRSLFVAHSGRMLAEIDFSGTEFDYLAAITNDEKLFKHLEPGRLIAAHMLAKEPNVIGQRKVELGAIVLREIAYGIGPRQLMELLYAKHNVSITEQQSKSTIAKVWELHPGLRKRQHAIQETIRRCKTLETPFGRKRVFYDRIGDALFRQAYAYAPRSAIADIVTSFLIAMDDMYAPLVHGNNYLLIECDPDRADDLVRHVGQHFAESCIPMNSFKLHITPNISIGKRWGSLEQI